MPTLVLVATLAAGMLADRQTLRADEGMWTFDNPPLALLKARYSFTPTTEWLNHLRLSTVRINDGGTGSFVSPTGLVLTNHHVALGQLEKMSTAAHNYARDGFYAKTREDEMKCPDIELNVLVSSEDVTARIAAAVKISATPAAALEARQRAIAAIEKDSLTTTALRSDVVSLYQGSEYWLYRYKAYTDVRIVFAPEQQIAFFGGDPDNFTYPRYDLDFALFRVYENNAPVANHEYLRWNTAGAAAGDLVFVSGNPGSTDRLDTVAQLETQRDLIYPISLAVLKRRIAALRAFGARGPEQLRQATGLVFDLENALKAETGEYQGLRDPALFAKRVADEKAFRDKVRANPQWAAKYDSAWQAIADAEAAERSIYVQSRFQALRGSSLAGMALELVQYATEKAKPDPDRLDAFHDAQGPQLEQALYSPAPIYKDYEEALLTDALQESSEKLGPADPFIVAAFHGRPVADVVHQAMSATSLADPAARRALVASGAAGVSASTDPLVVLARAVDPFVRRNTKLLEAKVESVEEPAADLIGQARFAVYGHDAYPDATFTPRLSFGTVKGYPMNGTMAPPRTTFYGLYDRALGFDGKAPFDLPARVAAGRDKLDLSTPLDFVTTNDIIGGNSGSPVVNRQGELVGLIFDGNIESLVGRFVYSEETNRAVAVHCAAILETLRKLYDAGALANEMTGPPAVARARRSDLAPTGR
jgi:hypothetical protein